MSRTDDGLTRAERWVRSAGGDVGAGDPAVARLERLFAERERREDERWERLHRKLNFLPLIFILWSLAISAALFLLVLLLGLGSSFVR